MSNTSSTAVEAGRGRKRKAERNSSSDEASDRSTENMQDHLALAVDQLTENRRPGRSTGSTYLYVPLMWFLPKKHPLAKKSKSRSSLGESKKLKNENLEKSQNEEDFSSTDHRIRAPLKSIGNINQSSQEDFETKKDWNGKDFSNKERIGSGGFSDVYKVKCKNFEGRMLALKQVSYESLRKLSKNTNECAFHQEFKLHETLRQENIVKAVGFYRSPVIRNAVIVMEYCNRGDLQDYLGESGLGFPRCEERSHKYCKQIAKGLQYLHLNAKIIHMDIKLENILISDGDVAKITDFGFSIKMHAIRKIHWKSKGGTSWYKPPEQLKNGFFDSTADIWAFGCIAFELILHYHPFFSTENFVDDDSNSKEEEPIAFERMVDASLGKFRRPEQFESQCEQFRVFIKEVLSYSRLRRPTAKQLGSIGWLSSEYLL